MMFPHTADVIATIKACERADASISSLPSEYQLGSTHPTYAVFGCATSVRGRFVDITMSARDVDRTLQVMMPAKHGFKPGNVVCVTVQLGRSSKGGLVGFAVNESPGNRVRVRFVKLVRTLVDDGMSVRQACMKVGIDTSRFARLEAGQGEVGIDQIRKTCKRMRLALSFFDDDVAVDSELIAKLQTLEDAASGQIEALQVEIASLHDVIRSAFALRCAISAGDPEKNRKARAALSSAVEAIRDVR